MSRLTLPIPMRALSVLACTVALSGCAQIVADQEKLLGEVGFTAQPADTPQRQAMLANLPSHWFVRQVQGTEVTYTYADPLVCDCLYVGSELDYANYRRLAMARTGPYRPHGQAAAVSLSNASRNSR